VGSFGKGAQVLEIHVLMVCLFRMAAHPNCRWWNEQEC
jgi:hypothetical protein